MVKSILVANTKGGCGKTLIATTLAASMATQGRQVVLIDADRQKSSLHWLSLRPTNAASIIGINGKNIKFSDPQSLKQQLAKTKILEKSSRHHTHGDVEWVLIDAPGGLRGKYAEELISTADIVVIPFMISSFDAGASERFLHRLHKVKRVRKGKIKPILVANRVRSSTQDDAELSAISEHIGLLPAAKITDRVIYRRLASEGLSIFDRNRADLLPIRGQWFDLLRAIHDAL